MSPSNEGDKPHCLAQKKEDKWEGVRKVSKVPSARLQRDASATEMKMKKIKAVGAAGADEGGVADRGREGGLGASARKTNVPGIEPSPAARTPSIERLCGQHWPRGRRADRGRARALGR